METFEQWWQRVGRGVCVATPAGEDLARRAFEAARAQSCNYVADDDTMPGEVLFANGRVVAIREREDGVKGYYLAIGRRDGEIYLNPEHVK